MKFKFTGTRPLYYTTTGLLAEPGSVHELETRPDSRWKTVRDNKPAAGDTEKE